MSIFILTKKHTKSDIQKTWKNILIGYTRISKHLRVWAPRIHQVLITSEPVVNKNKRGADLLLEHPLLPSEKPLRLQTREPKPRSQPCKSPSKRPSTVSSKRTHPEDPVDGKNANKDELSQAITYIKQMRMYLSLDPKPRTNPGRTSGKNSIDGLVRPAQELSKSVTKTCSKVREPETYNEVINDPIHGNR